MTTHRMPESNWQNFNVLQNALVIMKCEYQIVFSGKTDH